MKKMMLWLCLMMIVPTLASADMVSISELRQQVEAIGHWTQTYEAHGRTIEVDVPIIVPEEQDWDFPSAEESWEEELQKVTSTEKIAAPVDLSAWDFDPSEDKSPLMKLPPAPAPRQKPKSLLWLWLTLMAILLAAAGALLYPH